MKFCFKFLPIIEALSGIKPGAPFIWALRISVTDFSVIIKIIVMILTCILFLVVWIWKITYRHSLYYRDLDQTKHLTFDIYYFYYYLYDYNYYYFVNIYWGWISIGALSCFLLQLLMLFSFFFFLFLLYMQQIQ